MKSIYLSARFERRDEIKLYRNELEALGIDVPARWLVHSPPQPGEWLSEEERRELALICSEDIQRAEGFIFFSDPPEDRGGAARHVEFGMAVAWSKPIIVVGDREHLFHRLPEVMVVREWADALELMQAARKPFVSSESA